MRRSAYLVAVLLAAVGLLVAGCGGETVTATPDTVEGTVPEATAPEGDAAAGKTVFTTTCAGCHTLSDAGTSGTVGPNLDDLKPAEDLVASTVKSGKGVMPSFTGTLDEQQIADVAAYVSSVAGG